MKSNEPCSEKLEITQTECCLYQWWCQHHFLGGGGDKGEQEIFSGGRNVKNACEAGKNLPFSCRNCNFGLILSHLKLFWGQMSPCPPVVLPPAVTGEKQLILTPALTPDPSN